MRDLYFILIILYSVTAISQENRRIAFHDFITKEAIGDIVVTDAAGELIAISDNSGFINIKTKDKEIYTNHINYRDTVFTKFADTLYIKPRSNSLNEVVIEEECIKNKFLKSIIGTVYYYRMNFGHRDRAATFIPAGGDVGKEIKKLRYWVVDDFGIKNLKYLPFKAALYSVDSVTDRPGDKIYESQVIKKEDNKKWTEVDITSEHIKMPQNGIFIVFEILDVTDYKQQFVTAKFGTIDAVPALRAKIFEPDNPHKSYYIRDNKDNEEEQYWQFMCCHFMMEAEFDETQRKDK